MRLDAVGSLPLLKGTGKLGAGGTTVNPDESLPTEAPEGKRKMSVGTRSNGILRVGPPSR